jgi:hypothetical protein
MLHPVLAALSLQSVPAACPPCTIVLDTVVELGSLDDPVGRSTNTGIARLPSGAFVLTPHVAAPQIAMYGDDGRFLRMYDRTGQGPGELTKAPDELVTSPDGSRILVLDRNRVHEFTTRLEPLRTRIIPFPPWRWTMLSDGRLVVNYALRMSDGLTRPIHILDDSLNIASSVDTVTVGAGPNYEGLRRFGSSASGGFWAARANEPRVDLYGGDGRHVRTVRLERDWFEPWSGNLAGEGYRTPYRPQLYGVREIGLDTLILFFRVADAKWSPRPETIIRSDYDSAPYRDTIIEVIEARSGRVLASERFDQNARPVIGSPDLVHFYRFVESGDVNHVVARLVVEPMRGTAGAAYRESPFTRRQR